MFGVLRPYGSLRRFGSLVILATPEPPGDLLAADIDPFRCVLIAAPDVPSDLEIDPYQAVLIH